MFFKYYSIISFFVNLDLISCSTNRDFSNFLSQDPYLNYNKKIFPKTAQSDQIIVSMKYSLLAVKSMDETLGQIALAGFIEASWTNDLLKTWAADIDEIVIPQDNVWKPSLTLDNTVETAKELGYRSNKIRINKDGTNTWKVGIVSHTSCSVDLSHYPFDTHTCGLQFIPWGYTEEQVKLENYTMNVDLTYYTENVQWDIDETSLTTSMINGASCLTFRIKIARRPGNVLVNYALPILILSILSSLTYMMPPDSGERIAYSVVTFLTLVIHITMIADNIPRSSDPITILSLYLTLMLVMSSLSMAMATLTLRIYSQEEGMVIPVWLKYMAFFLKCEKRKRCCTKKSKIKHRSRSTDDPDDDNESMSSSDDDESMDGENLDWDEMQWKDVGYLFDWAFFLMFFITTIIVAIFFYFPLAYSQT